MLLQGSTMESNNDNGNEDFLFDDLDNGELSAAPEIESQTLMQSGMGASEGKKSVSITPAQKQRAEKNRMKALALKKANQQSQQPLSKQVTAYVIQKSYCNLCSTLNS